MRESRTSGSVEGAMSNHSSYSDPIKGEEVKKQFLDLAANLSWPDRFERLTDQASGSAGGT